MRRINRHSLVSMPSSTTKLPKNYGMPQVADIPDPRGPPAHWTGAVGHQQSPTALGQRAPNLLGSPPLYAIASPLSNGPTGKNVPPPNRFDFDYLSAPPPLDHQTNCNRNSTANLPTGKPRTAAASEKQWMPQNQAFFASRRCPANANGRKHAQPHASRPAGHIDPSVHTRNNTLNPPKRGAPTRLAAAATPCGRLCR
jgi:hypothetical protein